MGSILGSKQKEPTEIVQDKKEASSNTAIESLVEPIRLGKENGIYPETAVITITTHGIIIVDQKNRIPETFRIPDPIRIIKVNSVIPTIANVEEDIHINTSIQVIFNRINDLVTEQDQTVLLETCKQIATSLKKQIGTNLVVKEIEKELKKDPDAVIKYDKDFFYNIEKGFLVADCTGKYIINKTYTVNKTHDVINSDPRNYDMKITIINGSTVIDLMTEINLAKGIRTNYGTLSVTTKDIITFLQSKQVKRIIIFDFSCSNLGYPTFIDAYSDDHRAERLRKRELLANADQIFWGTSVRRIKKHGYSTRSRYHSSKKIRSKTFSQKALLRSRRVPQNLL